MLTSKAILLTCDQRVSASLDCQSRSRGSLDEPRSARSPSSPCSMSSSSEPSSGPYGRCLVPFGKRGSGVTAISSKFVTSISDSVLDTDRIEGDLDRIVGCKELVLCDGLNGSEGACRLMCHCQGQAVSPF